MTQIFPSSSKSVGSGENDCPRVFEGEKVLILIIGLSDKVALTTFECHVT